jgi:hypothetical protein
MVAKPSHPGVVLSVALAVVAAGFGARAEETAAAPSARTAVEMRLLEFRPKLSPDTLLDYRPSLADRVAALPPAQISMLGDLITMLEALKERAQARPGAWRVGPVYLGANAQEYRPSDDELLAAELGDRIRRVVSVADPEDVAEAMRRAGIRATLIEYNRFEYRHADVMGSGRYFYASEPMATAIRLRQP